jgi:protein TonB
MHVRELWPSHGVQLNEGALLTIPAKAASRPGRDVAKIWGAGSVLSLPESGASMQRKCIENTDPEHTTTETTLARCLVDGDSATKVRDRRRRRKALGISFAIESIVLTLLIVAPLMTSVAQPQFKTIVFVPIAFGGSHAHSSTQPLPSTIHRSENFHSHSITFMMKPAAQRPVPPPEEDDPPIPGAGPLGGSPPPGATLIADLRPSDTTVQPPKETKKAEERRAVRVSEPIQQAQLIARLQPRYPPLALQTRKEGTVVLHAIISRDGRITALEVVSGSPWFDQAALDAVRQWRYRPTYLGGEPVEVETTITVIFRLSQ